jgi:hypothetical protein
MNKDQQVRVFDDADMIRDSVTMLCRDRVGVSNSNDAIVKSALDQLCWDVFALQSRNFPFGILVDKCSAIIGRSQSQALRAIRAQELANEICSPVGGW